jgi:carbon-monoxide dehydrogenase large subunit
MERFMAEGSGNGIGSSVTRLEDERLLRGGGRYVSDLIATSPALRVKVLRSPYAHAHLLAVEAEKARSIPGVVDVLTAEDLVNIGDLPCDWVAPGMVVVPQHPILARDRVRYVGEPVAAVAAETTHAADDALGAIGVEYEQLPAMADQEAAMDERAPRLHDAVPGNIAFRFRRAGGHIDRALEEADFIIRRRLTNCRVTAAPLEGRAVLSDFNQSSSHLTHYTSSQLPHAHARSLADCLGFSLDKLRLIAPDIGGGFGAKLGFYAEDVLCALLSMRTGRPCGWREGRRESFLATTHGRDHIQYVELAARRDGRIVGLRSRIIADIGAYAFGMGPGVPAINTGVFVSGPYDIPNVDSEVIGVYTNRTPTGPYRGAGHPEATFLIERMVDDLARELGRDPVAVRQANFVSSSAMPHKLPTGNHERSAETCGLHGVAAPAETPARRRALFRDWTCDVFGELRRRALDSDGPDRLQTSRARKRPRCRARRRPRDGLLRRPKHWSGPRDQPRSNCSQRTRHRR